MNTRCSRPTRATIYRELCVIIIGARGERAYIRGAVAATDAVRTGGDAAAAGQTGEIEKAVSASGGTRARLCYRTPTLRPS